MAAGKILERKFRTFSIDLDGAAYRVLSFLNDDNERHVASLVNEKRKVTVIGEEREPEEIVCTIVCLSS